MPEAAIELQRVLEVLQRFGLLLEADTQLPSVAGIVTQEPIRGSWWGHPQGKIIYEVLMRLDSRTDILAAKLISGKVTFIQRRLWPALIGVGMARESWQLENLTYTARELYTTVTKENVLQTDQLEKLSSFKPKSLGDAARELERMLLVYGESFHTISGKHAKRLETWEHWLRRVGFTGPLLPPEEGKQLLENILTELNQHYHAKGRLPWR